MTTNISSVNAELANFNSLLAPRSTALRQQPVVALETHAERTDRRAAAVVNVCCILSGLGTVLVAAATLVGGAL